MKPLAAAVLLCACSLTLPVVGQDFVFPTESPSMTERLEQLEAETQALRDQMQSMQRLPEVPAATASMRAANDSQDPAHDEYFTMEDLRAEMKSMLWTKGDYTIKPYGILWANMTYSTARTSPGSYAVFVPSLDAQGEDEFVFDGRMTRMGVDVKGPDLWDFCCASSGGKVEIDFQGDARLVNKGGVLLRHAYWEIKNDDFRLVMGQTWDVISPLNPGTVMYSVGWGLGNIGYRRAQLRGERYYQWSDATKVTLQGAATCGVVADFSDVATAAGAPSGWPGLQARIGVDTGYERPISFGMWGNIGEQIFDFAADPPFNPAAADDLARRTWSIGADVKIPLTERLVVSGEFFTGENLGTFLGGALQGIDRSTRESIRTTGGWIDIGYDWTCWLHSHAGYGIDDPVNTDVTTGRNYNQFYYANLTYDVTEKFMLGIEARSIRTGWEPTTPGGVARRPGEAVSVEFVGKYAF